MVDIPRLGQHQQEGTDQGEVAKQELQIPKNTVGYRLK